MNANGFKIQKDNSYWNRIAKVSAELARRRKAKANQNALNAQNPNKALRSHPQYKENA